MTILLYEFVLSILLTAVSILLLIALTYYVILLLSILSGLLGAYSVSIWFTKKADILSSNIKNTYDIIRRKNK